MPYRNPAEARERDQRRAERKARERTEQIDAGLLEHATPHERKIVEAILDTRDEQAVCKQIGISPDALRRLLKGLRIRAARHEPRVVSEAREVSDPAPALERAALLEELRRNEYKVHAPDSGQDIDELVARRKAQYAEKKKYEDANALIRVDIQIPGPIGILHFGDPHVDDDGTDIAALESHTQIVRDTPGMFAGNVGDTTNNWVGRLARLYGEQSTSAEEAWLLAEWFVKRCRWLYMVAGNHDCWSGAGDPLKWIAAQAGALRKETNVRLDLHFPNGRRVRVNVRHDFAGHSMWNPAHGSMRAAQQGVHDHILVNGHKHVSGYGPIRDPNSGVLSHCIQVASYKRYDRYAKERGFRDQTISPCAVTVIDPEASETSLVQVYWEPEPTAEFLTWLRAKRRAA